MNGLSLTYDEEELELLGRGEDKGRDDGRIFAEDKLEIDEKMKGWSPIY